MKWTKEKWKEYRRQYLITHREYFNLKVKEYQQRYPDRIKKTQRTYYIKNREKILKKVNEYRNLHKKERKVYLLKSKQQIRERVNKKYKNDINFKLSCVLRSRLLDALKNEWKGGSAIKNLGCSIPFLKKYLENKFQSDMTWQNFGYYGWHIDHIKPLKSFNLSNPEDVKKACHYTNLQPLWAKENISKGAK